MTDRSSRLLERALLFSFVIHGVAMVTMALLLLPGMPGGGTADDGVRLRYIASHPWLWRLGWIPWGLTALSDLLIAIGLLRTAWIPKVPAAITTAITIAAILPDQAGQILWMTRGIELARAGDAAAYFAFETRIYEWIAVWAGVLYTIGALGWTWCFAAAGVWSRVLTWLSVAVWGIFAIVSPALLLPGWMRAPDAVVSAANAVGFVLMQVWFALVALRVRAR
jgi:hypothetical protein